MRRTLIALFLAVALPGCSGLHRLTPMKLEKSDEMKPPLKIAVIFARTPKDLEPVKGWYGGGAIPAQLYAVAKITNISDRIVVLPGFSRDGFGSFRFTCASSGARQPPFFISDNGQLEGLFLKPQESVYAVDNMADHIAFLQAGHYVVEYQYNVEYTYATRPPPDHPDQKTLDTYHRDHQAVAQGSLDVVVQPHDVYSDAWFKK